MNKVETIFHPVRFKIIQVFLDGQSKTAKMLAKELKDIPQASLYRQLDALVKAEVLIITEENQIRGTVEKVYSLNKPAANLSNDDVKEFTKEEHLQYFLFFTAQLSRDFETYLSDDDIDFLRDGVGYRQVALHLTDQEFLDFAKDIGKVYEKYMQHTPASKRTKRIITNIMMPKKEGDVEHE
ncbi:helix-turn-helix domain-containing protein [Ferdinandcohnia quinoae]|uniref:Helix-turn-helix domain-containing protein n=1 Tax=Fredinandcohnia quinoae TaxID=2918902 RepID=A0AAW5EG13_9BACI|nr:helix-turn-helix domain-containing protein [Fredinandcohnia sp. SECRCQ15]MCH1627789.1 helix-turn-helix domain-containing protein [Fredinandcohnia sp. SECRCQ15]